MRLLGDVVRVPDGVPHPDAELPTQNPDIEVTVPAGTRPLTLEVHGFRAIGWGGEYDIPATAITIHEPGVPATSTSEPFVLAAGIDTFVVSVSSAGLPEKARKRTIVYEGHITAPEVGGPITDPIRFVKPAVGPAE